MKTRRSASVRCGTIRRGHKAPDCPRNGSFWNEYRFGPICYPCDRAEANAILLFGGVAEFGEGKAAKRYSEYLVEAQEAYYRVPENNSPYTQEFWQWARDDFTYFKDRMSQRAFFASVIESHNYVWPYEVGDMSVFAYGLNYDPVGDKLVFSNKSPRLTERMLELLK